jgi:hypothetical protein
VDVLMLLLKVYIIDILFSISHLLLAVFLSIQPAIIEKRLSR